MAKEVRFLAIAGMEQAEWKWVEGENRCKSITVNRLYTDDAEVKITYDDGTKVVIRCSPDLVVRGEVLFP